LDELGLEGAGVDLGQQVTGVHDLAFREVGLHQLAVDPALQCDGVERGDRAEGREVDVQIAGADWRDDDRNHARRRRGGGPTGCLRLLLRLGLAAVGDPGAGGDEAGETENDDDQATTSTTTARASFRNCFAFSLHSGPLMTPTVPGSPPAYRGIR
jgi:hypothetical protein